MTRYQARPLTGGVAALEAAFPTIPWRKPSLVSTPWGKVLACRVCIVGTGFTAADVGRWPKPDDPEAFRRHMRERHGVEALPGTPQPRTLSSGCKQSAPTAS